MSLNALISNQVKPWLDTRVNSIVADAASQFSDLTLVGAGAIPDIVFSSATGGLLVGTQVIPCMPLGITDVNAVNASNISVANVLTIVTTGGAETRTLPDGLCVGQIKSINAGDTMTGNCVITVTTAVDAAPTITLTAALPGEGVDLVWTGAAGWLRIGLRSGIAAAKLPTFA